LIKKKGNPNEEEKGNARAGTNNLPKPKDKA